MHGGTWWERIWNHFEQGRISEFPRRAPVLWCVQSYNMCEGKIGSILTFLNTDTLCVMWMSHMARDSVAPLCGHASRELSQSDPRLSLSFLYLSLTRYFGLHLCHVLSWPSPFSHTHAHTITERSHRSRRGRKSDKLLEGWVSSDLYQLGVRRTEISEDGGQGVCVCVCVCVMIYFKCVRLPI